MRVFRNNFIVTVLTLCCFCFSGWISATSCVIETNRFADILDYIDSDTLVICDLDDTIIEPTTWLGSDEWFCREIAKYKSMGFKPGDALELALAPWTGIQYFIQVKLVEEGTDLVVREMQRQGHHVMGLTTRGASLATRTVQLLRSVCVDFSDSAPVKEEKVFLNPREVIYKNGTLFTSGTYKGNALFTLIPDIKEKFSKVVFINDKETHLCDVKRRCDQEGVSFIGLRYGKADERKKAHREDLAAIQFHYFGKVMTNEEAENLSN